MGRPVCKEKERRTLKKRESRWSARVHIPTFLVIVGEEEDQTTKDAGPGQVEGTPSTWHIRSTCPCYIFVV